MFFSCLDENYVVAGQEFYSCPGDDHLQGKNRILTQLPSRQLKKQQFLPEFGYMAKNKNKS